MGVYLNKPKRDKRTLIGSGNGFVYAASSMQGWRTNMEDADICCPNLSDGIQLYGVFDGHGGSEVSIFVEKNFSEELLRNQAFLSRDFPNALSQTFMRMDELLCSEEGKVQIKEILKDKSKSEATAGCTANVALINEKVLYVANAGDSRTLLCSKNTPIRLSEDHKPDNKIEFDRIKEAGGNVSCGRVNGNLNLSRALGDLVYKQNKDISQEKQLIIAKPDIKIHQITDDDEFILMGCDGVWETLSDTEIIQFIRKQISLNTPTQNIVEALLDKLVAPDTTNGGGCDNMTCILVTLKSYEDLKEQYLAEEKLVLSEKKVSTSTTEEQKPSMEVEKPASEEKKPASEEKNPASEEKKDAMEEEEKPSK